MAWQEIAAGLAPELALLAGAFVILYATVHARDGKVPATIAFAATVLSAFLAVGTLTEIPGLGFLPQDTVIMDLYGISVFSQLLKLLFAVGTGVVVLASPRYMSRSSLQAEYYALMLVATIGMMIVASSRDLLTLFLGVEVASFASYILAGSFKEEPTSNEAALKYFITGALSSTITLYGMSLLYGATGTLAFDGIAAFFTQELTAFTGVAYPALQLFVSEPIVAIGIFMVLAGLGFKFTVAPFHMWAADVYTGAPDTVSAWLAGVGKGLGLVALLKTFVWALSPLAAGWEPFVAGLAIITMTWGNLVAIRQDDIKRMLAYSSIAQAGYILIVLPVGTAYAIGGGVFHTLTNLLMKGGAFLVVAAFARAGVGSYIQDYKGLAERNPWLAFSLSVFLLSLAGIPPLGGFFSKFVLFSSAVEVGIGGSWLWWLAVAGVVNSAISLWYYARWIRAMYTHEATHPVEAHVPAGLSAGIAVSLIGIVAVGFFAGPVVDWSVAAADALLAPVP